MNKRKRSCADCKYSIDGICDHFNGVGCATDNLEYWCGKENQLKISSITIITMENVLRPDMVFFENRITDPL